MNFAHCFTLLLLGVACIVNSMAILKLEKGIEEAEKEIGYLFDWLSETNRRQDKLDHIVQGVEE